MPAIQLVTRDDASKGPTVPLLATLLVLVIIGFAIGGVLYILRQHRRKTSSHKPTQITVTSIPYSDTEKSTVTTTTTSLLSKQSVPEIRITFPEEEGVDGKRKSGRVVIVQVGEAGAAFVRDVDMSNEQGSDVLPPYKSPKTSEFSSVDLDRVGGLKEKHDWV